MSLWWDIATHEQYTKENIVPRRLRWDVPINDGLLDQESIDEWYTFFNDKGIEVQLNKVLEQKDAEIKQRKRRKYLRDTNDYQLEQTFKWQVQLKQGRVGSTVSSPHREVRIVSPGREQRLRCPVQRYRSPEMSRMDRGNRNGQGRPYRENNTGLRTPKPWWKNKNKSKSPRLPYWKNSGNRNNQRSHNQSDNQYGNSGSGRKDH